MVSGEFTTTMILAILPEIGLVLLAAMMLVFDLLWRDGRVQRLAWFTTAGLALIMAVSILYSQPGEEPLLIWGGMLRLDMTGFVFRMLFLAAAALTSLFATQYESLGRRGEFYVLLLVSTLGMSLMASSADLIMLYLAIETTSIPLYVLAGFIIGDKRSVEAGIKYLLFGAMSSAVMLYGLSLLYGFTGTTQLYDLAARLVTGQTPQLLIYGVIALLLVGFGFKISAVPFHFWAPDVYEGGPTPVAGFLSTASKAAGFAVLLRVLQVAFPDQTAFWTTVIAVLATLSMLLGNYLALAQKSVKRLLAYSSIAQAGYMLIGVAAGSSLGTSAAIYYLMAYLVTNLAAFGIVTIVEGVVGSDELSAFAGLSRRAPGLALAMLAAMLSLGGIPPFAGFFAKLIVFASAVEANLIWLVLVGIFNAVIGLYYYLVVLKVIYLGRAEDETPIRGIAFSWRLALIVSVIGILILGFWFSPWFQWAQGATGAIWIY